MTILPYENFDQLKRGMLLLILNKHNNVIQLYRVDEIQGDEARLNIQGGSMPFKIFREPTWNKEILIVK